MLCLAYSMITSLRSNTSKVLGQLISTETMWKNCIDEQRQVGTTEPHKQGCTAFIIGHAQQSRKQGY